MEGVVYILKLERPLGTARHSAQYYVGWSKNLNARLRFHRQGRGAAFTKAAVDQGIRIEVVWSAPGTRQLERWIKNRKNTARFLERYHAGKVVLPA
ncbi:MAG: GIY-YIG nuclease family protein [Chloroflexota bacterium]|nr:GIY-YIG nuclease family protein [Chloroflexota bacterium]